MHISQTIHAIGVVRGLPCQSFSAGPLSVPPLPASADLPVLSRIEATVVVRWGAPIGMGLGLMME